MSLSTKKLAPKGTPDWESMGKPHGATTYLVDDPVTKVQMSAATIAGCHVTGRDQPWNGGCRRELSQNTERMKDETSCGMARQLFDERVPRRINISKFWGRS